MSQFENSTLRWLKLFNFMTAENQLLRTNINKTPAFYNRGFEREVQLAITNSNADLLFSCPKRKKVSTHFLFLLICLHNQFIFFLFETFFTAMASLPYFSFSRSSFSHGTSEITGLELRVDIQFSLK